MGLGQDLFELGNKAKFGHLWQEIGILCALKTFPGGKWEWGKAGNKA